MSSSPHVPKTLGSPVARSLDPFTNKDLMASFISGAAWGGAAIGILGVGAWLIGVMRHRVYFSSTAARTSTSILASHTEADTHIMSHASSSS